MIIVHALWLREFSAFHSMIQFYMEITASENLNNEFQTWVI